MIKNIVTNESVIRGMKREAGTEVSRLEEPLISYPRVQSPPSTLGDEEAETAVTCSRPDYTQLVRSRVGSEHCLPAKPILSSQPLPMKGLFSYHGLVLRPQNQGRETALKHPLVGRRTQGPIRPPSQPSTQGEARAGRGLDRRRRVQQVAAASGRAPCTATPRAGIMDVELSYFALLALEFETPDEDQDS